MVIKNIVNRDIVNLTNCEHEPIHIPGSIQPHGFLLGVNGQQQTIEFCSGNCNDFIQVTHQQLLGKTLQEAFGTEVATALNEYLQNRHPLSAAPLNLQLNGRQLSCSANTSDAMLVLEFEPMRQEDLAIADIYLQTKQFTDYMQNATTLQSLCQAVATETRTITGYDRVMIYKFDEAYNGEVFAESCREDLEPFLGLHYPHTDIPAQARQLYIKNLLRLIADVNYTPVPLYTIDDGTNKTLDLSLSTLRSVSPIHVQYLHNMGVGATLTISLLLDGRLWGLIACHHYSPKYISLYTRIAAQLQGHFLTSQIPVRHDAEEYIVAKKVNTALDTMLELVFSSEHSILQELVQHPALLQLTNATGVVLMVEDALYSQGEVPNAEAVKKLAAWLYNTDPIKGFNTEKLVDVYPGADEMSSASGIIYHSLGTGAKSCIIWCRAEAQQEVHWAGDPEKAIEKNANGLSPRKSFELWKEIKRSESLKWHKPELLAASNFANALQKHVHMLYLGKEEQKQRLLSQELREANAELENINWIGTHDLKEPLRKIQMFASRILEDKKDISTSVSNLVEKMSDSASRMQTLIKDILTYSNLSHTDGGYTTVSLEELLQSVVKELSYEVNEKNATIDIGHLPQVKGIPFLLHQLFVNLLGNAFKFCRTGVQAYISVQGTSVEVNGNDKLVPAGHYHVITVEDNGIGFDNAYAEAIFKVFTRLHKKEEYRGTGVGLAMCRKIMQTHKGYIKATGVPGECATFSLYFPAENGRNNEQSSMSI